jgi:alkyl hydroperoxide reductase subunit AhpC
MQGIGELEKSAGSKGMSEVEIDMGLSKIGDTAPDFEARTTLGTIRFYDWMEDGWAVILAFPEAATKDDIDALHAIEALEADFAAIGCKVIGCITGSRKASESRDSEAGDFEAWAGQVQDRLGRLPPFPIIRQADPDLSVLRSAGGPSGAHTRTLVVVGPDKRVKLVISIPVVTASMFGEILRLIESLQYAAERRGAKPGCGPDDVIVLPCGPANEDSDRGEGSKCRLLNGRRKDLRPRKRCG